MSPTLSAPYPIAAAPTYHRHRPEHTELYSIIDEHYPRFVQEIERSGGHLPRFVRQEFEDYLECGLLEHGFLRVKCDGCAHEHLVAFSCKRRGFCPSCGARRMVESAAHLVDRVFPEVPVRQRRLSRHGGLRACSQEALPACRPRVGADLSVPAAFLVGRAAGSADPSANGGSARYFDLRDSPLGLDRVVRRPHRRGHSDSALRLRPEPEPAPRQLLLRCSTSCIPAVVHMLFLDGAYAFRGNRAVFHRARRPTGDELNRLLDSLSRRIVRLLERRGLLIADPEHPSLDRVPDASLDHLQAASVSYRIAIGPQAGRKALTLYSVPPVEEAPNNPLLARRLGFSLHAATVCEAWQRSRLERLCRYITRPPTR